MTKYPSILTYHSLGERGRLVEDALSLPLPEDTDIVLTEKVDGTYSRIVVTPDGEVLFGSREEWLGRIGDLIHNPSQSIVNALKKIATHISCNNDCIKLLDRYHDGNTVITCCIETHGGNIGKSCKDYSGIGSVGIRLFDVSVIPNYDELLSMPIEKISSWREHGGQEFLSESQLQEFAQLTRLALTPRLGNVNSDELPHTFIDCMDFINEYTPVSQCTLDAGARGGSEGIVLRTTNRKFIAKMRREDYERSMRGK
jgi:hypothetical protein